jgi:hypothetical protein
MQRGVKDWAIWAGQQKTPLREVYRLRGEIAREEMDAAARETAPKRVADTAQVMR